MAKPRIIFLNWVSPSLMEAPGTAQKLSAETLDSLIQREDGLLSDALKTVAQVTTENADLIKEKFPKLTRFLSGYNLNMVWDEKETLTSTTLFPDRREP